MKKRFVVSLLMVSAVSAFAFNKDSAYHNARKFGAMAKIQVHVVDDCGRNVSNASISVFMGMNFHPKGYYIRGMTDTNGMFTVEGKTCGDELVITVTKSGHYISTRKMCFAEMGTEHDVRNGKWMPFGKKEDIILRRIMSPASLVVFDKLIDIAQTNVWLGIDMEKMDFTSPLGNGSRTDFEVRVEWDGLPAWESRYCNAEIRFANKGTGGYYVGNMLESSFPYVYEACHNSSFTEKNVHIVDRNGDPHTTKMLFPKGKSLVTRTRSVINEDGQIKSANYGCIRKFAIGPSKRGVALLRLSYVFNPTPNDTNLEPKR